MTWRSRDEDSKNANSLFQRKLSVIDVYATNHVSTIPHSNKELKIEKANSMKTAYIIKVNDLLVIKLKTMRPCWWTKQLFAQSLHEKKRSL